MTVLEDILSQEIIQKLGWTLLHFIWQAAVIALLLAILLRVLRKSTANLRYIIACLALVLIVLLPVITIKLVPVSAPQSAGHIEPAPAPAVLSIEEMPPAETIVLEEPEQLDSVALVSADSWKQRAVELLEPALPYIVSGWLVGVFGLSLWHLGGWAQLQRLRRRMVRQVNDTLGSKLKVLAERLRVKQTVQLMESTLVQIPTVVGWLRPVILLPASALTGLSAEQLEAILAHELAHIKRFDYLINILQTVVEILGFYHPAVWWVSHKIRAERENCCDDLAVSISGDRVCYARALTLMEEIRAGRGQLVRRGGLAVAATGGNLFRRIRRLLGKDSAEKTSFSWVPAVTAILLIIALAIPTTLALTIKSDSQQPDSKIDVHVDNDRSGESQQGKEPLANNIPTVLPTIAKSPAPSAEDKAHIQIDCLIVEVSLDSKMDRETTIMAENLLGNKISLRDTKVDVLLRKAAGATAPVEGETDSDKRVTQKKFETLVDMMISKGYMKILMNPTLEVINGKTAKISSSQHVPLQVITKTIPGAAGLTTIVSTETEYIDVVDSIEITPHVFADGHITLQVEATISSTSIPKGIEQIPIVTTREISTRVRTSPGESLIIGGLKETGKSSETDRNVKGPKEKSKEVLFILTPTIISPTPKPQEKTDVPVKVKSALSTEKLKQLGLAVAMYADDHDENLPDSLRELKPYIRDEQDFNWLLDNIKYLGSGKSAQRNAELIPIAYDRELLEEADGTNVLSLDFSVRFLDTKEFEKLDIKRAEFLIEARFLSVSEDFLQNIGLNTDSPDEAKELFKLKSEMLAASDGSKTQSLILDERNVSLLLEAVRAHKDSIGLATPQILTREGKTAEVRVFNNEIHFISGYTEPNRPFDKPEPKYDSVKEGIFLSLKPKLTTKKNVDLEFELEITQVPVFEERMYKGKYPYKHLTVQRIAQSTRYIAHNGQTLLCWGHKISKQQEGRTEQKDLLVLITAQTVDSSEQDKPAKTENLIATEPPRTTSGVIIPPVAVQSRTERRSDKELEKTKPATERRRRPARSIDDSIAKIDNKDQVVQKLFKLKHHNSSQMGQIILPLVGEYGHISADERTNNLLVIDTAENLMRIEKIIAQFDVSKVGQTVTEIFEIRYANPVEIVELLKKLINGRPGFGSIIEPGKEPIVLVPELRRKWIIAKASPENIKQIGEWIKKLDISKSIGMDPADAAAYEQLETIVDLSDLRQGMSFGEVVEKLENSVEPPLQIQPIWKDLLENSEVEQATPAGMDPLSRIKLRKALEILIASVTSSQLGEFGELTYIVDDGVILIGTVDMLHPRMVHRVYYISDFIENAADADALIRRITETIEPDSWYKLSDKGEGTIMAYPALQPKKFAVMQTYKIHQQIEHFLEDTRSSRDELRKTKPEIMIETVFLSVSEDYLKDVGLDANTANFSDGWTRLLAAKYPAGPNGQPYGIIIDDLHVRFLLRAVQAHHDSKAIVAPRVRIRAGTMAEMGITEEYRYIKSYNEPNRPSDEPQPKRDKVKLGPHIWLTPKLTDNNRNVNLDLKLELRQLKGIIEGKYKGKYPYYKPIIDVISAKMPCTIPDGKIMLIGGLKINEHIKKEPGTGGMRKLFKEPNALQLKDLPLIGAAFSSKDKIKDHKMLLILVKPTINPQQKATKLRPRRSGF